MINSRDQHVQKLSSSAKESRVPATRISRLVNFGNLAAGLSVGALSELTRRTLARSNPAPNSESLIDASKSIFLTEENVERIVDTLCKVRGAALKLGQMLSIQDDAMLSPTLQRIFGTRYAIFSFFPCTCKLILELKCPFSP